MHQRRIIREAVADFLLDKVDALGDRVFRSREAPANVESILEEGAMANVYARRDTIKPENYPKSGMDGGVKRTLELAIEVTATGSWVVDDKLDDITDEIEALLEPFEVPGLPAAEIRLTSTEIDSTDEFEVPLGGALMLYEIDYWRPYRTDDSEEFLPCHAFTKGSDGEVAPVASCGEGCAGADICGEPH